MRSALLALLLGVAIFAAGCCTTAGVHNTRFEVSEGDEITHRVNDRSVTLKNWILTIDDKQQIEIPRVDSVIDIKYNGDRMTVVVNGKTVYEDPAAR